MSVPLLHSKTCLLAVLYVPYGHHGPPFSSDEPLRPESHLYDMPTIQTSGRPSRVNERLGDLASSRKNVCVAADRRHLYS